MDYLRLFEICLELSVDYSKHGLFHLFGLFEIICFRLFESICRLVVVDYWLWIMCGLFETGIT